MTPGTYKRFIFSSRANYCFFPLAILFIILAEGINALFFRLFAIFELINEGEPNIFDDDVTLYWIILGILTFALFIVLVVKDFLLSMVILNSNEQLHEDMIEAILRSPVSYFDTTPSGILMNKFSNDLGVLDNALYISFIYTFEGPIVILSSLINISSRSPPHFSW